MTHTPKQRMLNAYRGKFSDRRPVAPEFWYYYPAKVLGLDMIAFQREAPFHLALKTTFEKFGCEGWGTAWADIANPDVETRTTERRIDEDLLEVRRVCTTPAGELTSAQRFSRDEPSWVTERPIKNPPGDLDAFVAMTLADPAGLDTDAMIRQWEEVGESYLLEADVGVPFFDYYAGSRQGGLEQAIFDFAEHEAMLLGLRERYVEHLLAKVRIICDRTPFESLFIGCAWSCNSLIGPNMWRRWDRPVIQAVADAAHERGRLVHVHFHGRCMETVGDFAEMGLDCVCPFERPPGGDVCGLAGLKQAARLLAGRTTMNGNVHTVETLIRGAPRDVRREVRQVLEAFADNPRVIVGTGDQVGRETPEENLHAMIEEART